MPAQSHAVPLDRAGCSTFVRALAAFLSYFAFNNIVVGHAFTPQERKDLKELLEFIRGSNLVRNDKNKLTDVCDCEHITSATNIKKAY